MKLAIDTNRYVDFMRGVEEVVAVLVRASEIHLPLPVVAELRSGFVCGRRAQENERRLVHFLSHSRVRLLLPDESTTHHFARTFAQLRAAGRPIPTNDLWIAALAIQHGLPLYTRDGDFARVPGLATL